VIRNRQIFITGGAGFIGSTFAGRLVKANQVTIYDNYARDSLSSTEWAEHPNIHVVRGDVLDSANLSKSMKGAQIVVHAAAIAGIDTVIQKPTETMRVNLIGTANALEAARQAAVSDRFVEFSTSEVFGTMAFKPKEDSETVAGSAGEARWSYAVSKMAGEHLAMAYYREFGMPVVCVRPFNVYGPGQVGESAMNVFIAKALRHENIEIHGDGNQIRAWCYVDDFVDCLLRCIESPRVVGESINIGNAKAVMTTYGLAQTICRVLGSRSRIVFKPALSAEVELRIPSVEKAHELLGFRAAVELDEGIRRTAEWVEKRLRPV
jgi:UDP-glucose 4-epimerase